MHKFESQPDELAQGTKLLHGQYQIERFLGRGGFGITYLARDSLDRQVVIKECFPSELCCRVDSKVQSRSLSNNQKYSTVVSHFVREARRLAKFKHHNIVGVHQVFEENNSAYMALDFIDGTDFQSILESDPDRMTPQLIQQLLRVSLKAIDYIHKQSILHRDLSPDNFLLDSDDNVTLIDFGAAREYASSEACGLSAMIAVKEGYSPHEFYLTDAKQDHSSDLYSLGATFYKLVTGKAPPDSQTRLAALAAEDDDPYQPLAGSLDAYSDAYSESFLSSLDQALMFLQQNRIQTAEDWIEMLDAQPVWHPTIQPDRDLQSKIARLVRDVNSVLEPRLPASLMKKNKAQRESPEAPAKKEIQQVDIFGNQIDDVDAWLREQDKKQRLRRRSNADSTNKTNRTRVKPGDAKAKSGGAKPPKLFSGNNVQRRPKNPIAY